MRTSWCAPRPLPALTAQIHTRVACGFATLHDVATKAKEDRMESFFLSETLKYLFLLFDPGNPFHDPSREHVFSTQGHLFPLLPHFRGPAPGPALHPAPRVPGSRPAPRVCNRTSLLRLLVYPSEY